MSSHNYLRSLFTDIGRGKAPAPVVKTAAAPEPAAVLDSAAPVPVPAAAAPAVAEPVLDAAAIAAAAAPAPAVAPAPASGPVFDDASDPGSNYSDTDVSLKSVAAVQEWAETDDLEESEGYADRLLALMVGIADVDVDGELSDDEQDVVEIALNTAWDYLSGKGVSDEDLDSLLNDWDNETGARVQELIASKLPDGDEAAADEMDSFVFGDGSDEAALDSAVLDATYKKKIVVRKGKKVRINKRVAGRVRLSAKQKLAVRKMLRKSHGAKATMRRAKSNRVRKQMGL